MEDKYLEKISDAILEKALAEYLQKEMDADETDYDALPDPPYSDTYKKKLRAMVRKERYRERLEACRRNSGKVAAVLVCAVGLSAMAVMNVQALRQPIFNLVEDVKEKCTGLLMERENTDGVTEKFQEYEPGYVPEGFEILYVQENENSFVIHYSNTEQEYYYSYFNNVTSVFSDAEDVFYEKKMIGDHEVLISSKADRVQMVCLANNKKYEISGGISLEEAEKILKSVLK